MNNSNVEMAIHSPRMAKLLIVLTWRCLICSAQYCLRTLTVKMLTNIVKLNKKSGGKLIEHPQVFYRTQVII